MMSHTESIIEALNAYGDPAKADWWYRYMHHKIRFIGVGIPEIRKRLHEWHSALHKTPHYLQVADELLKQEIAEYKLAGILLYQIYILRTEPFETILEHVDTLFRHRYIYDWNTCDWLCVRVLTPIIETGTKQAKNTIIQWSNEEYLWHARASLVPFAQCKTLMYQLDDLVEPMTRLIQREERFSKTAVGWLLREIYKLDPQRVYQFLESAREFLIPEVVHNALKYADTETRQAFKEKLKSMKNGPSE